MKKIAIYLIIFFITAILLTTYTYAEQTSAEAIVTEQNTKNIDSYVLFWPLVAGNTSEEPVYFLKKLKEQLVGLFISEDAKKGEYQVILGTKRLLEAEKLLKKNKKEPVLSTLEKSKEHIKEASGHFTNSLERNDKSLPEVKGEVVKKLENVNKLLQQLKEDTDSSIVTSLAELENLSKELQSKLH